MENMDKGLTNHRTKMGADKSAENAQKCICPICLAKHKSFNEKKLHRAFVVRGISDFVFKSGSLISDQF